MTDVNVVIWGSSAIAFVMAFINVVSAWRLLKGRKKVEALRVNEVRGEWSLASDQPAAVSETREVANATTASRLQIDDLRLVQVRHPVISLPVNGVYLNTAHPLPARFTQVKRFRRQTDRSRNRVQEQVAA